MPPTTRRPDPCPDGSTPTLKDIPAQGSSSIDFARTSDGRVVMLVPTGEFIGTIPIMRIGPIVEEGRS